MAFKSLLLREERNLTANLELDVDYREVSRDDPELTAIYYSGLDQNNIPASKVGRPKKYYLISGEGLKMVAMAAKTEQGKYADTS